ncbi:MAG: hypothetical protein ABI647_05895 [Gemmatimonadota bacterium]
MVADYLTVAGAIALWTAVAAGWGALAARAFRPTTPDLASRLWLGVSTLLFLLQLIHLVVPISTTVVLAVVGIGLAALTAFHGYRVPELRSAWTLGILGAAALAWVSLRALGPVIQYDSGMYHLTLLDWYQRYPIVPGLANLHGRFGFNNSIFLLTAAVDRVPLAGQGHHVVNGFLALSAGLGFLARALAGGRDQWASPSGRACLVFLVGLLGLLLTSSYVTSPSPVFAAALLPWFGAAELLTYRRDTRLGREALVRSMIHFAAGATVKLSNAAMGAVAGAILVTGELLLGRSDRYMRLIAKKTVAVAAAIMGVWCLGGAITAGYLAYPIPWTALPVSWRVPLAQAEAERAWIEQYARYWQRPDNNAIPDFRAGGPQWSLSWISTALTRTDVAWMLVVPIGISLVAVFRLRRGVREGYRGRLVPIVVATAAGAGLIVWLSSAPRPDFSLGPLWVLAATLYAAEIDKPGSARRGWRSVVPRLAVGGLGLGLVLIASNRLARQTILDLAARTLGIPYRAAAGLVPLPIPPVALDTLPSGLIVAVPVKDNRCWRTALPCTPHPEPGLRLRAAGDLSKGFENPGPWAGANFPNKLNKVWLPSWRTRERFRPGAQRTTATR